MSDKKFKKGTYTVFLSDENNSYVCRFDCPDSPVVQIVRQYSVSWFEHEFINYRLIVKDCSHIKHIEILAFREDKRVFHELPKPFRIIVVREVVEGIGCS